ncbi:MAG: AmmeMemoRadiSam system radical SAM enzyme [Anaerolineales bacterium]
MKNLLDAFAVEGDLYEKLQNNAARCFACGHRCLIRDGKRGICQVRFNQGGKLFVPHGYVAALQNDPIEKKPFAHVLPGASALTFGMLGCNLHCDYCQNWFTSQFGREEESNAALNYIRKISPLEIVEHAQRAGSSVIVSSYNEPLITSEWAAQIFKEAKARGLLCAYVSNGNNTPEVMEYLRPYLDAYKIDLKCMSDKNYRKLGGTLQNALDGIRRVKDMGIWLEVVTLVIPGFNDSNEELWDAARFLAEVSPDLPWHVTAFHQDYKMTAPQNTDGRTLIRAAEIGREAGLRYVYAGNLPGAVEEYEDTRCPKCGLPVVRRRGYFILENKITAQGTCPSCGEKIAGLWRSTMLYNLRLSGG